MVTACGGRVGVAEAGGEGYTEVVARVLGRARQAHGRTFRPAPHNHDLAIALAMPTLPPSASLSLSARTEAGSRVG
jgi:hypothetical protein